MKILIFILLVGQLYSQTIFETDIYFDLEPGEPIAAYDNSGFVEWFEKLPFIWKQDLVDQNYAEVKQGYYELTLKNTDWIAVTLADQKRGVLMVEAIPDCTSLFQYEWMTVVFDTLSGDTNIVDFDSVDVETYFFAVNPNDPKKAKTKIKIKKKTGEIKYPKFKHFLSKADRKEFLKAHKIKKQKKKDEKAKP